MLPQTIGEISNGGIYVQSRKCGKKICRCARGKKHTGYFFFTRRDGKLTKTYILKSKLAEFSRLVKLAAKERKERRRMSKATITRNLRNALKRGDLTKQKGVYSKNDQMITPYNDEHMSINEESEEMCPA